MKLPGRRGETKPVEQTEQSIDDRIRVGVEQHLAVCEAVRQGAMDIGYIGLDFETGEAQTTVTLEDVDQTEAIIRDAFGVRFPYLIGRDSETPAQSQ